MPNLKPFQYFCAMAGLKKFFLIGFLLSYSFAAMAQVDSIRRAESTRKQPPVIPPTQNQPLKKRIKDSAITHYADSILQTNSLKMAKTLRDSLWADSLKKITQKQALVPVYDTSTYKKFETHPYLPLYKPAMFMVIDYHRHDSRDYLFYLLAGIVFVLAFIRFTFSKYFRNLFLLFFQTSLRQKQTRDQLLQDNLASLLTNFLFIISAGLYITLLIRYKNWTDISFWWLVAGTVAVLLVTYLIKYLFIMFTGWVFNTKEAAGSYVFVVFMVNKIMGVLLVPFLLVLSFARFEVVAVAVTLSLGLVILLFAYRYWVSFIAIRNKLKVNALHFFLYLCAVELLPLVLIYKVLINYFAGSL